MNVSTHRRIILGLFIQTRKVAKGSSIRPEVKFKPGMAFGKPFELSLNLSAEFI